MRGLPSTGETWQAGLAAVKTHGAHAAPAGGAATRAITSHRAGRQMSKGARRFLETRFCADFMTMRLHAPPQATTLADRNAISPPRDIATVARLGKTAQADVAHLVLHPGPGRLLPTGLRAPLPTNISDLAGRTRA